VRIRKAFLNVPCCRSPLCSPATARHWMMCMPVTRDLPGFPNWYVTTQGIGCAHQAFNGANDGAAG
jgi:hypothetical protein